MFLRKVLVVTLSLLVISHCQDYDDEEEVDYDVFTTTTTKKPFAVEDQTSLRAKVEGANNCGAGMKCVAYYLCSEGGEVITDGSFLIDERLDTDEVPKSERPVCPAMEFCCGTANVKLPDKSQTCDTYKPPAKCGFRNVKGLGDPFKSSQGITQYSNYAEFPWLMAVSNKSAFLGGGALIHPKVVLSAAHIFKHSRNSKLTVRGGEYNTQTNEEFCPQVEKSTQKLLIHDKFRPENLQNDAALLILDDAFPMTAAINTICLPPPDMIFDNKKCVSSGWGKSNFNAKERHQAFPKVVNLPVIPHEKCQTMLRRTRLGDDFILDKSFLCAGGQAGIDVCTGDGGSPLACESDDQPGHYYVAGIVAGGIKCGTENIPGFYVKVTEALEWIDRQLDARGITGVTLS